MAFTRLHAQLRRHLGFWQKLRGPTKNAPQIFTLPPPNRPPYALVGPFSSTQSVGQCAHYLLQALQQNGLQPAAYDLTAPFYTAQQPSGLPSLPASELADSGGTVLLHAHPSHFAGMLKAWQRAAAPHRHHLVAALYFAEPVAAPAWQAALAQAQSIIVPSTYCQRVLQTLSLPAPIHVLPPAVTPPVPSNKVRYDFGLSDKALLVYAPASFDDTPDRKNPLAALQAFQAAFGDNMRYQLVIKARASNRQHPALKELALAMQAVPNARLITGTLAAADHAALLNASDIIFCPSHAEAFGLLQAQALWLGKPLLALAHSGCADFLTAGCARLINYNNTPAPYGPNTMWATPIIDHAAELLFELAEDEAARLALGQQARAKAEAFFSAARFRFTWQSMFR